MSEIKLRIDYIVFGAISLLVLLSLLTSDFRDPTIFNQLYPSEGIQNWTGLIGALIGGSLLEIFGPSTLLLPWLIIRIHLHKPRIFSTLIGYYYAFVIILLLSVFQEIGIHLGVFKIVKAEFMWQNGYAGKLVLAWLEKSINLSLSLFALSCMLILAIIKMFQIISPIPFFKGLFYFYKKLFTMILKKMIIKPNLENKSNIKLNNYKGKSKLYENDSEKLIIR